MLERADQHHSVQHRHTEKRDETNTGTDAERHVAQVERGNSTDRAQRHRAEDQQRIGQRSEREPQQGEDQQQCERHRHAEPRFGLHEILELSTEREVITRRQFQFAVHAFLDLLHKTFHVAAVRVHAHVDPPLRVLVGDLRRSILVFH